MVGGPERCIRDARGKVWQFEAHPRCGPVILKPNGDPAADQPGSGSQFWVAWGHWHDQGEQFDGEIDGVPLCKWLEPAPEPLPVWLGGRNYAPAGSELAKKYGRLKP